MSGLCLKLGLALGYGGIFGFLRPLGGFLAHLKNADDFISFLQYRAPIGMVDANGAVGANRSGLAHPAAQRDAIWLAYRALLTNNTTMTDKVMDALEWGWNEQAANGGFNNGEGATAAEASEPDAFFVQFYCHLKLLYAKSNHSDHVAARFAAMDAGLPLALTWLMNNTSNLTAQANEASNRYIFDAGAFILGAEATGTTSTLATGKAFMDVPFAPSNTSVPAAGQLTFLEKDGQTPAGLHADSSYQAVSLLRMAELRDNTSPANLPANTETISSEALAWLKTRIGANGEVSIVDNSRSLTQNEVNYPEVALGLYYAGWLDGDSEAKDKADLVSAYTLAAYEA